ncbi:MAG: 5-formyltetrahydrofolate cyclo-ligase [Cellvibrionales bacterium]|jgi:5-formyltetrahydrofolate cyclo-ligase
MDAINAKRQLREELRERRDNPGSRRLPPAVENLVTTEAWQRSQCVASYLPRGTEQTPGGIDALVLSSGRTLAYPRVVSAGQMVFKRHVQEAPLEKAAYGILAPEASAPTLDVQSIDLFLVPLLACDDQGVRLGYGGGYYDRVLAEAGGFRCGVGFAFQRVTALPNEDHDARLHGYLCETGMELFA